MLASYENIRVPCARDFLTSSTILMVIILMLKIDASEFLTHSSFLEEMQNKFANNLLALG